MRRALDVLIICTDQVIGNQIVETKIVCGSTEQEVPSVHIEIKGLIETLAANVNPEFGGVVPYSLGEIVGPLKRVPDLRDFTFQVVPDIEFTRNIYEGNTFTVGAQSRGDSEIAAGEWRICPRICLPGKASCLGGCQERRIQKVGRLTT